ncbi:mycofactocin-coupled SDR family oxidoreductase [Microbacterium sp. X-17]|uniref:mycofactocin-coupled SDR family oxidoreductase n=1 Tax=Microbacterium sp. X-17 TaxID=3144404 RepID=UPI0031F50F44
MSGTQSDVTSLEGKVAFITGGARAQGRSHAVALARQGASIVVTDIGHDVEPLPYSLGTAEELAETVAQVEAVGGKAISALADTRDLASLEAAATTAVDTFGSIDIVIANAGIAPMTGTQDERLWHLALDINLTGTFNTVRATMPRLIEQGRGGSIVLISSVLGIQGTATDHWGSLGYVASKHGVVGLMQSYANLLAPHRIRVNSVHPTGIATPMVDNPGMAAYHASVGGAPTSRNALPVEVIDEIDVSHAISWLVSDTGRYVTGVALPVDAGYLNS